MMKSNDPARIPVRWQVFRDRKSWFPLRERPRASACAPGEERGGDIGECVGVQAPLQGREDLRAEAAGARADFENPQAATFGQRAGRFLHSGGDRCEPVACQKPSP